MTVRRYQTESYATQFEGLVTATDGVWVNLETTLFYPTAGGQPHDTGRLAGGDVINVENQGDEVWHQLRGAAPVVGQVVAGEIDWPRRYRHMQRHSGQHLLSQAFLRVDPRLETRSVSLSSPPCTLDLANTPDEDALRAAERVAAEAVYENLEISAFEVSEGEVARYPLRRPPKVSGTIRLVKMGDFELSACGGTHLRRSGEAGPIKLLRSERVKGGLTRVTFCCGYEALSDYALKHQVSYGLAVDFSVQVGELPERITALKDDLASSKRAQAEWQGRYAALLAERLLGRASPSPHGRVVCHVLEGDDSSLLHPLADTLTAHDDVIALLGARQGDRARLLFARGQGVALSMAELLNTALPLVEGRGGGKPELAQGGGSNPAGVEGALEQAARSATKQTD